MRLIGLTAVTAAAACSASAGGSAGTTPSPGGTSPDRVAQADSVRSAYTPADVGFMTGMIHHHAQALVMARMAPTHGASGSLQIMAERIIVGQNDEITLMQRWLRDRNEPVPEPADVDGAMHGMDHAMHMPGMLSAEQLEELDAARGPEFDRVFLTYMIQHHEGAITMVEELFRSYGAAQEESVFKLGSDIAADQSSEIDRMQSMLREMLLDPVDSP
jgi:uncharacterized protein (DUF305 family)